MKYLIFLLLIPLILLSHQAFANTPTQKYPLIMIVPSESCQNMIKFHMKTDCPTDDMLLKYDTSNQKISGHFIIQNGNTIRDKPEVKNHYLFYQTQTVCVDCAGDYMNPDLFQIIIIEPHGFTYVDKYAVISNNKWLSYSDRHMAGCNTATIGYSDSLLNDTIKYMESNCTQTSFNSTKTNIIPDQPWSYDNPYSSLHLSTYLKSFLHNHDIFNRNGTNPGGLGPNDCIRHQCSYTDPYKKAGW